MKSVCWRHPKGISNNRLHPEKVISRGFRTGVRLPSGPPNATQTNTYFFSGGFAVKVSLWYEQKNAILDESLRWRFSCYLLYVQKEIYQKSDYYANNKCYQCTTNTKKFSDMDVYLFHVASVYRLISCLHKMQQSLYTTFPCHSTFNIFFICCSSFSVSATIYHKRERKSRSFSKKIRNFRRDSFFNYSDADIEVIITIRSRTIPISKYALRRAV